MRLFTVSHTTVYRYSELPGIGVDSLIGAIEVDERDLRLQSIARRE